MILLIVRSWNLRLLGQVAYYLQGIAPMTSIAFRCTDLLRSATKPYRALTVGILGFWGASILFGWLLLVGLLLLGEARAVPPFDPPADSFPLTDLEDWRFEWRVLLLLWVFFFVDAAPTRAPRRSFNCYLLVSDLLLQFTCCWFLFFSIPWPALHNPQVIANDVHVTSGLFEYTF